jgi:hypothetical protein
VIQKLLVLLLPVMLLSCKEGAEQATDQNNPQLVFKPAFEGLDAFLNYRQKVNQRKDLKRLPSLLYTHKSGYSLQSIAYLDKNNEILKATLDKIDTNGKRTSITFYFLKEVLSIAQVFEEQLRLSNLQYTETFYFYNANQSPITCYSRKVTNGKQAAYMAKPLHLSKHQNVEDALNILSDIQNQTGDFSLSFQGFDEAFNKKFVQFGSEQFSSNLAYAPTDPIILAFEKNPKTYNYETFSIQFQNVTEASGLQYQVLTDIQKN